MKFNIKARRKAREFAVQALYQWQLTGLAAQEVLLQFMIFDEHNKADKDYFKKLFTGVTDNCEALDQAITPFLDRPLDDVSPIELAIARLGACELLYSPELPYRVALNEAIELSKIYGGTDSHKFVNGVLDKLAQQIRNIEIASERKE